MRHEAAWKKHHFCTIFSCLILLLLAPLISLLPTRSWEQGLVLNTSCPCRFQLSFHSQFLIQAVRGQQSQEQTRFALEGIAGSAAFWLHLGGGLLMKLCCSVWLRCMKCLCCFFFTSRGDFASVVSENARRKLLKPESKLICSHFFMKSRL